MVKFSEKKEGCPFSLLLPVYCILEVSGVDLQADGGPHVKSTREIGENTTVEDREQRKKPKKNVLQH